MIFTYLKKTSAFLSIKTASLFVIVFFTFLPQTAQSQKVPKEMYFGGMRLTFTEYARKQVQADADRLVRSPTYVNILADRINLYFPIIERILEEEKVPEAIKFLAVQESGLISDAVSSANAVGFWQFKDFTAREVGLTVNRQVDERLNIVSATKGAAKYLKKNNYFYNNWIYAVMAYNTGRGGAKKYLDESLFKAKKMTIDRKTHWYVKKFLAHIVAFSPYVGKPHSENLWLKEDSNVKHQSLDQIARKHKTKSEEVKKYNKWLKRGSVPSDKTYTAYIPKTGTPPKRYVASHSPKGKKRISEPEKKIYPTELKRGLSGSSSSTIITLNGISSILAKSNDDIHSLSARAGLSEKKFRKYNEMGPGDKVLPNEFYYTRKKKNKSSIGFHVAKAGETLWGISQQYGIKKSKLAKMNRMTIVDELEVGRVLWMKKTRPADVAIEYHKPVVKEVKAPAKEKKDTKKPVTSSIKVPIVDSSAELKKVKIHTVAKGESLWAIAKKYKVSVDDILRWNELPNPDALRIGQNIQVKPPIEEAAATKELTTHRVQRGETLYAISRKYDMTVDELMELNGKKNAELNVGEALKVYAK